MQDNYMGVFRFENRYAVPTREQRDRYMKGEYEEHRFGPDDQIVMIVYDEAVYIKDDIDDVRILFTGVKDRERAYEELNSLLLYHQQKSERENPFQSGEDDGL